MTYKEAWEAIHFRHCEETCDYAYMDNCQEGKCEYYMALQALNRQYYAECGSVWTKPLADRKTEPPMDEALVISFGSDVEKYHQAKRKVEDEPTISKMEQVDWKDQMWAEAVEDEPQTERSKE